MGMYEVEIRGVKIKATLLDNIELINKNISELKVYLQKQRGVVGVDVKLNDFGTADKLIICAGDRCFIIQLRFLLSIRKVNPESSTKELVKPDCTKLREFLCDTSIRFVGTLSEDKVTTITVRGMFPSGYSRVCVDTLLTLNFLSYVKLSHLAARILKKPNISEFRLADLGEEVEMKFESPDCSKLDLEAVTFTTEQIKDLIHDAYMSYVIGDKLLWMLDA